MVVQQGSAEHQHARSYHVVKSSIVSVCCMIEAAIRLTGGYTARAWRAEWVGESDRCMLLWDHGDQ